ncbi:MAG: glycosyltransferase [Anaerolineae bacterium]
MRIAFFTPLSPQRSALADFGEGLAVGLARQPDVVVDLFIDDKLTPDNAVITQQFRVQPYQAFEAQAAQYDICLYSMGDHADYHGYMLDLIERHPGVVILNDLVVHRCILQHALKQNKLALYLDELEHAYGVRDRHVMAQIQAGLGEFAILDYPLFEGLVDRSLGVIVQNQYARDRILAKRPAANITCLPYPFFMPPGFSELDLSTTRATMRGELGWSDQLIIGSFGIFVPSKHLDACLLAFARLVQEHPNARYLLGGAPIEGYDLQQQIRDLGLEDKVFVSGWLPPWQFVRYMLALDVGIHLRYPHIGGTPYTPIRLMGLGICTIVSDIEPLAELPLGACIKIAPDSYQAPTLAALLKTLAAQPELRRLISANGQQVIDAQYRLDHVAQATAEFVRRVAKTR